MTWSSEKRLGLVLLPLLAASFIAMTMTGSSTSQTQTPTLRIVSEDGNSLPHIVITGNDIRTLPSGTNYIGTANGGVWKTTNGGNSTELQKVGQGTLVLPSVSGLDSRPGSGVLKNTDGNAASKELTGTLILTSNNEAVYEFRDLSAPEFSRVSVSVNNEQLTLNGTGFMGRHRPIASLKRWPFKRLLIIPTDRIANVEGWSGRGSNAGFYCKSQFCQCNGQPDCLALIKSGSCKSAMNCDGAGGGMTCFCDSNR